MNSMLVRVRCVDDGRELLVEGRRLEWRVQVATIKRLVLEQRRRQRRRQTESTSTREHEDDDDDVEEALGASFLLFQGRILPDGDMINLFSLTPADFFVFVQDAEPSGASSAALTEDPAPRPPQVDSHVRRQLLDMGFTSAQIDGALGYGGNDLDQIVERIMSGRSEGAPAVHHEREQPSRYSAADPDVLELQQKALADPFDAVMLLKERFSPSALASLTDNPASTIQTLRRGARRPTTIPCAAPLDNASLEDAAPVDEETKGGDDAADSPDDAIERLAAMGFARDLVAAMYEACECDENLTANALLQTLET